MIEPHGSWHRATLYDARHVGGDVRLIWVVQGEYIYQTLKRGPVHIRMMCIIADLAGSPLIDSYPSEPDLMFRYKGLHAIVRIGVNQDHNYIMSVMRKGEFY